MRVLKLPYRGVASQSIALRYNAVSFGDRNLMFRDNVLSQSTKVKIPKTWTFLLLKVKK